MATNQEIYPILHCAHADPKMDKLKGAEFCFVFLMRENAYFFRITTTCGYIPCV